MGFKVYVWGFLWVLRLFEWSERVKRKSFCLHEGLEDEQGWFFEGVYREMCWGGVDRIMLGSGRVKGKSGSSGEEDILKELRGLGSL